MLSITLTLTFIRRRHFGVTHEGFSNNAGYDLKFRDPLNGPNRWIGTTALYRP